MKREKVDDILGVLFLVGVVAAVVLTFLGMRFLKYLAWNFAFFCMASKRTSVHGGYCLNERRETDIIKMIVSGIVVAINLFFAVKECFF